MERQQIKQNWKGKVKYIEDTPINREVIFNSRQDFYKFYAQYYNDVVDYCIKNGLKVGEYYSFKHYVLNKDGLPRRRNKDIKRTGLYMGSISAQARHKARKLIKLRVMAILERELSLKYPFLTLKEVSLDYWELTEPFKSQYNEEFLRIKQELINEVKKCEQK